MRALENTSFSKLRLAPRLESPFASRALYATLAARRTRRVNREVARYDGAWSRTHPTTHRLPDIPSAEKGWFRHDDAEATAACPCGRQKKKKSANDPLAQATGTESPRVGNAPGGRLLVTGDTLLGRVPACEGRERTLWISNVGACNVAVSSVAFRHPRRQWSLLNNPFPSNIAPGSNLLVVQYYATEEYARSCDLVTTSDDPTGPIRTVELIASTVWLDCCRHCCHACSEEDL